MEREAPYNKQSYLSEIRVFISLFKLNFETTELFRFSLNTYDKLSEQELEEIAIEYFKEDNYELFQEFNVEVVVLNVKKSF